MNSPDLVIIIGSFAGMLVGFFTIMRYTLKQGSDDRTSDRKERQALTEAIKKMATSTDKVAQATIKGNNEAKQRNGHLGEQSLQLATMLTAQTVQLTSISNTLTSSAIKANQNAETAYQGTEEVRKTLKKNKPTGTFSFSGDLK